MMILGAKVQATRMESASERPRFRMSPCGKWVAVRDEHIGRAHWDRLN
jgi:hypothetical protein